LGRTLVGDTGPELDQDYFLEALWDEGEKLQMEQKRCSNFLTRWFEWKRTEKKILKDRVGGVGGLQTDWGVIADPTSTIEKARDLGIK